MDFLIIGNKKHAAGDHTVMNPTHKRVSFLTLVFLLFSFMPMQSAQAATLTVTNTNDFGAGSLRQAIAGANSGDTIIFDAGLSGGTITLVSTLTFSNNVTIDGSALTSPLTISGNSTVHVFQVNSGITVILDSLMIENGNNINGGGIYNQGTLTVNNSTFSTNSAELGSGGGIYNRGNLTVNNSTFSGNSASSSGGGIYNQGTLTVNNSTFSGNSAAAGSGIFNQGTLTVDNSTFSGNSATNYGGGIFNGDTLEVNNSTFSGNSANSGGGILNLSTLTVDNSTFSGNLASASGGGIYTESTLEVSNSTFSGNSATIYGGGIYNRSTGWLGFTNTIAANSPSGLDCYNDGGSIGSGNTNNLVETHSGCGTPALSTDPILAPLADNGGPTQTMALNIGSPAIDAGNNAACESSDQRGISRPQGVLCDLGAYELDQVPILNSFAYQNPASSPTNADALTFRANFNEPVQDVDITDFLINSSSTASISGFTAINTTAYDVTLSGGNLSGFNGTVGLDLASSQNITDLTGNALYSGEPGADLVYTVENIAPTVTINQASSQSDPASSSPVHFTVVFSKDITFPTFDHTDVIISGTASTGAVTVNVIDAATYDVEVEVLGDGTVIATIPAGGAQDYAGNTNAASTSSDNQVTLTGFPSIDVLSAASTSIPSGSSHDIGLQPLGSGTLTFTIENNGSGNLTVNSPTFSNLNNVSSLAVISALTSPVLSGGSTTFTIQYNVDTENPFSFDLEILNSDANHSPYQFMVQGTGVQYYDFGDAPDPTYPTLLVSSGARHKLGSNVYLGTCVDGDSNGQPSLTSTADDTSTGNPVRGTCTGVDDEDGVTFTSALAPGESATLDVIANASCNLSAWVDFNQNGSWTDAGEEIFSDQSLTAGVNGLNFNVPITAALGNTFARFRCTTDSGVSFTGTANDGEVEDYRVPIVAAEPEIDIQRLAGTSIVDDGTDTLDSPGAGAISLTYTIDNSSGTSELSVSNITVINPTNVSGILIGTSLPINVQAGTSSSFDISFTIDAIGAFSFELDITNNDSDEGNYDILVSGTSSELVVLPNGTTYPSDGAELSVSPNTLRVQFNKEVRSGGGLGAADYTGNYMLVEEGVNESFDTISCLGGVAPDDMNIIIDSVDYDNTTHTATLSTNSGSDLPSGRYRLFVCGTTSIEDMYGIELNNGLADTQISFIVNSVISSASVLPITGFPMGKTALLAEQATAKTYTASGMILVLPKMNQEISIVGVPRSDDTWDVSWLGSRAGWLEGSAYPTWAGNTVLTGHVWDADNQPGVFANLKSLKYGDQFTIHAWGQTYTYEVRQNMLVTAGNTKAVMQHEELDWITLLTCESYNPNAQTYPFRRIVRAVLVKVE